MGQDLLGKLQAQITFDSCGQAALTLGTSEVRIGSLTVPQGEERHLCSLIGGSQGGPELPFTVPGVWAEDHLQDGPDTFLQWRRSTTRS